MVKRAKLNMITFKSLKILWYDTLQLDCLCSGDGVTRLPVGSRVLREEDQCLISVHQISTVEVPAEGTQKCTEGGQGGQKSLCPANGSFCAALLMSCSPNTAREQESRFYFTMIFFLSGDLNIYLILWLWNKDIISARILGEIKRKPNSGGARIRLFSWNSKTSVQRR